MGREGWCNLWGEMLKALLMVLLTAYLILMEILSNICVAFYLSQQNALSPMLSWNAPPHLWEREISTPS